MNNPKPDPTDAILDQHVAALRSAPLPAGPSADVAAATLARLQQAGDTPRHPFFWQRLRSFSRQPMFRLAAAAAVVVGLFAVLANPLGGSIAFAQVVRQVRAARAVAYTVTMTAAGGLPPMTARALIGSDGQSRRELPGGSILIRNQQRTVLLSPEDHTATRYELKGENVAERDSAAAVIASFRRLTDVDAQPLGERIIDGVATRGFTARLNGWPVSIWADARTALPVRIEFHTTVGPVDADVVMHHFQLDPPTDAATFSTDAPAGYTLKTETMTLPAAAELPQTIAALLNEYAQLSDGALPERLDDWSAFTTAAAKLPPEQMEAFVTRVGLAAGQLYGTPSGYTYRGREVKLGQKDQPLFWLTPQPTDSTLPVIYGDLRVETMRTADLPTTRPTP